MDERVKNIDGWMEESALDFLNRSVLKAPNDAIIVEIGAWKGRSTAALYTAQSGNQTVITVDTWLGQKDMIFHEHQEVLKEDIFLMFMSNMESLDIHPTWYKKGGKGCRYLRMEADVAATFFDPGSIYLLFLDSDHNQIGHDIDVWKSKVRGDTGIFCGHDYYWKDVKEEINSRLKVKLIDNLWIASMR